MHDKSKVKLGSTRSNDRAVSVFASDPATYLAGLCVSMDSDGLLSLLKSAGQRAGVSLGKDLSDAKKTSVLRYGQGVGVRAHLKRASGVITVTSYANLVSGTDDVVTVGATAFTAQAGAATPGDATFQAATTDEATAASLALQINSHATASTVVRARAAGDLVFITALHGGTAGNSIVLTYTNNGGGPGATVSGSGTLEDGEDNPDYAAEKTEICELISTITVAGCVTQGYESEAVVLSNGQSFDFKFNLPHKIECHLRLTITTSENNQVVIDDPDTIKLNLMNNIAARYRLGRNFEPQRYFSVIDAPWASQVLLEYSIDGGATYVDDVYDANYDDLFDIDLANVTLVET